MSQQLLEALFRFHVPDINRPLVPGYGQQSFARTECDLFDTGIGSKPT